MDPIATTRPLPSGRTTIAADPFSNLAATNDPSLGSSSTLYSLWLLPCQSMTRPSSRNVRPRNAAGIPCASSSVTEPPSGLTAFTLHPVSAEIGHASTLSGVLLPVNGNATNVPPRSTQSLIRSTVSRVIVSLPQSITRDCPSSFPSAMPLSSM